MVYVRLEGGKDEWAEDLCEGSEENEQPYAEFAEPWEDTDIVFVVEVSYMPFKNDVTEIF